MNAIEVKNVSKHYAGFSLQDVTLCLPRGTVLGLVGENGAGKSTLIKLIMNATGRDGGSIRVLGVDNESMEFDAVKEDIGVVLDEAYYPESLTAAKLNTVMKYTYKNWDEECYRRYLHLLNLPDNKAFKDFSRGMKMKLAISVALSHKAKLLVLDEATSGLDPMIRDEILDVFHDFIREDDHSILLSSHIVSDLEKVCDYIAFLHNGKLQFCEEKDVLLEQYAVIKLSHEDFEAMDEEAIISVKKTEYGVEALVKKSAIPTGFSVEHTTLENIILFCAKGEKNR